MWARTWPKSKSQLPSASLASGNFSNVSLSSPSSGQQLLSISSHLYFSRKMPISTLWCHNVTHGCFVCALLIYLDLIALQATQIPLPIIGIFPQPTADHHPPSATYIKSPNLSRIALTPNQHRSSTTQF